MKKILFTIAAFFITIVFLPSETTAYIIDGNLSDWGITLSVDEYGKFNHSWEPASGFYAEANDWGPIGGIPSGGEACDVEAIYFNNDQNYLYFAGVGSIPPSGCYYQPPYNWPYAFGAGDLAIKFGVEEGVNWKTTDADYALGLRPSVLSGGTGHRNPASIGEVKQNTAGNLKWYHEDGFSWPYFNEAYFDAATGTDVGTAVVTWAKWSGGTSETGSGYIALPRNTSDKGTWIWEAAIPISYFGDKVYQGQHISVHWAPDCVNDYIELRATVIPEPKTYVLFFLGCLGLILYGNKTLHRRVKKK